jgi:hypothetical protein
MDELLDEAVPDARAISYEQWDVDFFLDAITEERVLGAVNTLAGQRFDIGPMGVGPGRVAKVRAYGEIGKASATSDKGDQISYRVLLRWPSPSRSTCRSRSSCSRPGSWCHSR